MVREICVLIKYSPKREKLLGNIQDKIEGEYQTTTLDKLCQTRWTVRADCCRKIVTLYDALFSLWDHCLETGKMDRELKSGIGGVKAQMAAFSFFFGLQLGYRLYAITDNLSKALQEKKMSAISGQRLARATLSTIEAMRNDESFDMFYEHVLKKAEGYNMVEEPKKGRKRSKPKYSILQYVDGYNKGEAHHPETTKVQFQQIYLAAIDYFVVSLKERFEQPTMLYMLPLKACCCL